MSKPCLQIRTVKEFRRPSPSKRNRNFSLEILEDLEYCSARLPHLHYCDYSSWISIDYGRWQMRNVHRLVANHSEQFRKQVHRLGPGCQHCPFLWIRANRFHQEGNQCLKVPCLHLVTELDWTAREGFWNGFCGQFEWRHRLPCPDPHMSVV